MTTESWSNAGLGWPVLCYAGDVMKFNCAPSSTISFAAHGLLAASTFAASTLWSGHSVAACVTAYQHAGYGGTSNSYCQGGEPLQNDSYSAFRVPRGTWLRIFEHNDQSGLARTYFQDVPWVGDLYNDKTSSLAWGDFSSDDFVMLVASDPQFSWGYCSDDPASDSCRTERARFGHLAEEEISRRYNRNLVAAMNRVGAHFGHDRLGGAVVNGDLTEFGNQGPDLGDYIATYEHGLAMNVYLGLGNHDYQNNVDDCYNNGCANSMIWYLKDQVQTLNPSAFDYGETGVYYQFPSQRKRYEGSFGYSWDIGPVHFAQLNNHPAYERSWSSWNFGAARRDEFHVRAAMSWLRADLQRATAQGQKIVLNLHDWGAVRLNADLRSILNDFPVSAVFAGHWHGTIGEWERVGPFADGRTVPVLLSGSAHYGSFLVSRYLGQKLYVWVMIVDQLGDETLQVRRDGINHRVGDLGTAFSMCSGCSPFYQYAYDLR